MANRHLSRSIVLQTLFEWDFNDGDESNIKTTLLENAKEFGDEKNDDTFMKDLLGLVLKKKTVIDEVIEKAAPDWPIDKISIVDRNILRIGLSELLFGNRDEVPPKVAINESIELAKSFGGEKSFKFVNGVLGAVYKEIGEPGKDQQGKKKVAPEVAYEDMPVERKGGGVVYTEKDGQIYLALVHDIFGYWTLSKGGIEDGISEKEGAAREIKKELDLDVEVLDLLGNNEYVANHPEKGKIRKNVLYYLMKSEYVDLKLSDSGGLDDAKWFALKDVLGLNIYDDILPIITKSIEIITKK